MDGRQVASGAAARIGSHAGDICIGWAGSTFYHDGKSGQRADAFAGRLDDVMVFARALSEQEATGLARAPICP